MIFIADNLKISIMMKFIYLIELNLINLIVSHNLRNSWMIFSLILKNLIKSQLESTVMQFFHELKKINFIHEFFFAIV